MKTALPRATVVAGALLASQIFASPAQAQDSSQPVESNNVATTTTPYGAPAAPVPSRQPSLFRLSDGAASVIKLKRGNVNDDVIAAYVSSKRFSLSADDVVALHQEGVSDAVVTTMLQRSQGQPTATPAPMASAPAPENAPPPQVQPAPQQAPPAVSYVQTSPPVQTLVAPAPAPVVVYQEPVYYNYYDPYWVSPVYWNFGYGYRYPYYSHHYPYRYGYRGPSVSVGFHGPHIGVGIGFGGGVHVGGGFHGGYHGGGFHGHH